MVDSNGKGFYGKGYWGRKALWLNVPNQIRTLDVDGVHEQLLQSWGDEMESFLEQIGDIPDQRDPYLVRGRSGYGQWFYFTETLSWEDDYFGKVLRLIGEKDFTLMPETEEESPVLVGNVLEDGWMEASGYGPELLVDNNMEAIEGGAASVADWTPTLSAVLTKEISSPQQGIRWLKIAHGGSDWCGAKQTILSSGKTFRFIGYAHGNGSKKPYIWIDGAGDIFVGTSSVSWQNYDVVATTTGTAVTYYSNVTAGNFVGYDDMSVKEVVNLYWTIVNDAFLTKEIVSPHSGPQNIKIAYNGTDDPGMSQSVLETNTDYTIIGYARSDGTYIPSVKVGNNILWTGTASTDWQEFSFTFNSGPKTDIIFQCDATSAGYVEFDDILLTKDTISTSILDEWFPWYPYEPIDKIARWWTNTWEDTEYTVARVRTRNYDPPSIYNVSTSLGNEVWVGGGDLVINFDYSTGVDLEIADTYGLSLLPDGSMDFDSGYGVELLVDNLMENVTVTPPWVVNNNATLTKDLVNPQEGIRWLKVAYNGTNNPGAKQAILGSSNVYRIIGYFHGDGSNITWVSANGLTTIVSTSSVTWQNYDKVWLSTGTTLTFTSNSSAAGFGGFDNTTVKQIINPYWTTDGATTFAYKVNVSPYEGTLNLKIENSSSSGYVKPNPDALTIGEWYNLTCVMRSDGLAAMKITDSVSDLWTNVATTTWTKVNINFQAAGTELRFYKDGATGVYVELDAVVLKQFTSINNSEGQVIGWGDLSVHPEVELPITPVRLWYNDTTSPAPWLVANAKFELRVRVVETNEWIYLYDVPDGFSSVWDDGGPVTGTLCEEVVVATVGNGELDTDNPRGTINYLSGQITIDLNDYRTTTLGQPITAKWEVRGYYTEFNPPPLIDYLAEDFGFDNDRNDPEDIQRSTIANLTKYFGLKSSQDSYRIRGEISLFDIFARGLWHITDSSLYASLPDGNKWTYDGEMYTDLVPRKIHFDDISADTQFYDPDTSTWKALLDNELMYEDTSTDGYSVALGFALDVTQGYYAFVYPAPHASSAVARTPATVKSKTALTDAEKLTYGLEAGYRVVVEMMRIQKETFNFKKPIFGLSEYDKTGTTPPALSDAVFWIDVEYADWSQTSSGATAEEDIGDWEVVIGVGVDSSGNPISTGPTVGEDIAVRYWPSVASGDCDFCKSYKVRVEMEPTTEAYTYYDTWEDIESAAIRLKSKIVDVILPIHARVAEWELMFDYTLIQEEVQEAGATLSNQGTVSTIDIQAVGTCSVSDADMTTVDSLALPFEKDAFVDMVIDNITDGSSGVITGNTEGMIESVLSGGSLNTWTTGDEFRVGNSPTVGASEVVLSVDQRGDLPLITKYMDFDLSSNVSGTIWSIGTQWTGFSDATNWYPVITDDDSYSASLIDALLIFTSVAEQVTFGDARWILTITKSI